MFERTEEFLGGGLLGSCMVSPAKLVEIFGEPSDGDDYKVSGEYTFVDPESGVGFRLYDWKTTSLYDDCTTTPAEFWASTEPYDFHIGGLGGVDLPAIVAAIESLESSNPPEFKLIGR